MICPVCGLDNKEGAKFCADCGEPLKMQAPVSAQPHTEPVPQPAQQPAYNEPQPMPGQQSYQGQPGMHPQQSAPYYPQQPYAPQPKKKHYPVVGVIVTLLGLAGMFASMFLPVYKESLMGTSMNYFEFKDVTSALNLYSGADTGSILLIFMGFILVVATVITLLKLCSLHVLPIVFASILIFFVIIQGLLIVGVYTETYGISMSYSFIVTFVSSVVFLVGCCLTK